MPNPFLNHLNNSLSHVEAAGLYKHQQVLVKVKKTGICGTDIHINN